jgi:site-specific recombinase XerD
MAYLLGVISFVISVVLIVKFFWLCNRLARMEDDLHRLADTTQQKYNIYIKSAALAAGLDKVPSSHWGRHSFAVMMLSMGVSMTNLAKMMGHSTTKITEEVYAKVLATDLKKEYDKVNRLLK